MCIKSFFHKGTSLRIIITYSLFFTGSHLVQDGLKLIIYARMTLSYDPPTCTCRILGLQACHCIWYIFLGTELSKHTANGTISLALPRFKLPQLSNTLMGEELPNVGECRRRQTELLRKQGMQSGHGAPCLVLPAPT